MVFAALRRCGLLGYSRSVAGLLLVFFWGLLRLLDILIDY